MISAKAETFTPTYEVTVKYAQDNRKLNDIAYCNGVYVLVGDSGLILTSENMTDWTKAESNTYQNIIGIESDGNEFVAISKNLILRSVDGYTWESTFMMDYTFEYKGVNAYRFAYHDDFDMYIITLNYKGTGQDYYYTNDFINFDTTD